MLINVHESTPAAGRVNQHPKERRISFEGGWKAAAERSGPLVVPGLRGWEPPRDAAGAEGRLGREGQPRAQAWGGWPEAAVSTGGGSTGHGPLPVLQTTRAAAPGAEWGPLTERCAAALGICLCEGGTPPGGMGAGWGGRSGPLGGLCSGGVRMRGRHHPPPHPGVGRRIRPRLLWGAHCQERSITARKGLTVSIDSESTSATAQAWEGLSWLLSLVG